MKNYRRVYNFYVEKDEEALVKYLMPEYYIEQNIDNNKVDADYALRFLQDELNSLLNSFVNGGFSYRGFVLYPFFKGISKENVKKIKRLNKIAVFLNNRHDFSNSIKQFKSKINRNNLANILSALYSDFSKVKGKWVKYVKKPKCREFDIKKYLQSDMGYIKPLGNLKDYANKSLRKYLSGFYLHGSLATKDYVKGWSDVDTLAIISKETLEDPKKLLELSSKMYHARGFFYRIDPLQHHGSIAISEYDIGNYCQTYFPIPVFNHAESFFGGDKSIQFKARDFSNEAIAKLFWFVNYFRKLKMEKRFGLGSYDTKVMLHSITLFPTIYLQAKGTSVYKQFSFDIAKKDFKKNSWKIIHDLSSIRNNWKNLGVIPSIRLFSNLNPLFYYQLNSRAIDLFKDIKKQNGIDVERLTESMLRLSEEAWSRIKKNVKSKGS